MRLKRNFYKVNVPSSSYVLTHTLHGDNTDEVESLAAARRAALSGSEPSDSIRVPHSIDLPKVTCFFPRIILEEDSIFLSMLH